MSHRHFNVAAERAFRRAGAIPLLVALFVAASTSGAAALRAVPAEFQGTWVPSKATCESPVRVLVAADRLTLATERTARLSAASRWPALAIGGPTTVASWRC